MLAEPNPTCLVFPRYWAATDRNRGRRSRRHRRAVAHTINRNLLCTGRDPPRRSLPHDSFAYFDLTLDYLSERPRRIQLKLDPVIVCKFLHGIVDAKDGFPIHVRPTQYLF